MSEHLSEKTIQAYLTRTMPPNELLSADDHLAECESCLTRIGNQGNLQPRSLLGQFLDTTDEGDHLTYEQLESYVDNELDEIAREIIDTHKGGCRECSVQLDDLFRLRRELDDDVTTARTKVSSAKVSALSRFWPVLARYPIPRLAHAAIAAVIVGVIIWAVWFLTSRRSEDIAKSLPANVVTNHPIADNDNAKTTVPSDSDGANTSDINTGSPGEVVSLIDGNGRIELDDKGNLTGLEAPQYEKRIKAVLRSRNLAIAPVTDDLGHGKGVLMGNPGEGVPFALSSPVGKLVLSNRPQFRWQPLKDANSYVAEVYDANFKKVASSQPIQKTTWTVNQPLRRGIIYQWQVTALKNGLEIKSPIRPAPDAKFKILDAKIANEIEYAKKHYSNAHLLLGTLYAEAGLLDDAEREFQALLRKNPNSDIAKRLLNKVRTAR